MSDPRFARLKSDPRFRRPKKHANKVVLDSRFSSVLEPAAKSKSKRSGRVDKYGRALSDTHESDNLRRFYRVEGAEEPQAGPDYARGEALLESSDEEDEEAQAPVEESDEDDDGVVTLGAAKSKPIHVRADDEIDLDEDNFSDLDAQAAAYSKNADEEEEEEKPDVPPTRRLAVVNLDWDHVRAVHLYKIFSSVVSPSASSKSAPAVRGKVLSVRVYPSQFGKERMEKEEREGPPVDVFKKKPAADEEEEDLDAADLYETGAEGEYDEDALRQYQLERLRYYYAIVECDTAETGAYLYSELQGTELERSANVFDLSFVPDEMTFDDDPRDESTGVGADYKGIDFVTDALRHSRVKLTWDQDDPERNKITRRTLSRKEMEENDFRAYIASSDSESDAGADDAKQGKSAKAKREQLRALLLSGGDDVPEGWGDGDHRGGDEDDVDMEVTFMPALSGAKNDGDETTLEAYQRKMKEKRQRRKEEAKEKGKKTEVKEKEKSVEKDEFFGESESEGSGSESLAVPVKKKGKKGEKEKKRKSQREEAPARVEATQDELSLLLGADEPGKEPKHFNMKAVLKAEKGKKKGKKGKRAEAEGENELQEDFTINVKDERFKALHEDYNFAIDPSNPHFKKTKSMAALLEERSKRQRQNQGDRVGADEPKQADAPAGQSLQSLVASVKRKSAMTGESLGKRRKV
ncbi:hypothetical protein DENSPDRAFT_837564 [Dentipellis sp. KUC8613]|nr:hypothetical protein DENSPDRAFT_837564 [Dentipellis sp. KUC8613]